MLMSGSGPYCGADVYVGPVDPLFFPHHTNLDRVWWEWQKLDLENRLKDISGPLTPPKTKYPDADYSNFPDKNITLDWEIDIGRLAPKVKVKELMDIRNGLLRYQYSDPLADI
jgi:tyrosinase